MNCYHTYVYMFVGMLVSGIFLSGKEVGALDVDFRGQIAGWTTELRVEDERQNQSGVRYIPQLTLEQSVTDESFIDSKSRQSRV